MTVSNIATLKALFETGDKPTQGNFGDVFDTMYHGIVDVVRDHGADPTGATDSTTAIQAAIDAVEAGSSSGTAFLPRGTYLISTALIIDGAGTGNPAMLRGAAPQYFDGVDSFNATLGVSRINFDASASADDMILFAPIEGSDKPALYGGGVMDLMLDGKDKATRCLHIKSCYNARFENLGLLAATTTMLETGVVDTLQDNGARNLQHCSFKNIGTFAQNAASTAHGIYLGRSASAAAGNANTSLCTFDNLFCFHRNGHGLYLFDADGCTFGACRLRRISGTGNGLRLGGNNGTPANNTGAIENTFLRVEAQDGGAYAETGTSANSRDNFIYDYSFNNGAPDAVVEDGAGLAWLKPQGLQGALVVLNNNQTIQDSTPTFIDWEGFGGYNKIGTSGVFWEISPEPSRFTPPANYGVNFVQVSAGVKWENNNDGARDIRIFKNGAAVFGLPAHTRLPSGTSEDSIMSPLIPHNEGDYYQMRVNQTSGGPLDVELGDLTWFAIQAWSTGK